LQQPWQGWLIWYRPFEVGSDDVLRQYELRIRDELLTSKKEREELVPFSIRKENQLLVLDLHRAA